MSWMFRSLSFGRGVRLLVAAVVSAFFAPLLLAGGGSPTPAAAPVKAVTALAAPESTCAQLGSAVLAHRGASTIETADWLGGSAGLSVALASLPAASTASTVSLGVSRADQATAQSLRAASARVVTNCDLAQTGQSAMQVQAAGFTVPFFLKAITAGAGQLATWMVVASACAAALNVASAVCKPLADFAGGFVGALIFQAYDSKFGHLSGKQVLNSFVAGLGAVPLGVIGRSNASHMLSRVFADLGRWLRDSLLNTLPAGARARLTGDLIGLAAIGH